MAYERTSENTNQTIRGEDEGPAAEANAPPPSMAAPMQANTMPVAQAQPVVATMITSDQGSKMIGMNQGGQQGFGGVAPGQGGINFGGGGVPVQPIMAPPQPVNGMMQPVMRVNVSPVITSRTDAILPPKPSESQQNVNILIIINPSVFAFQWEDSTTAYGTVTRSPARAAV